MFSSSKKSIRSRSGSQSSKKSSHNTAMDPLAGHPGHLSVEQAHTLEKFKKELGAEGWYEPAKHSDAFLLRFLRARKFDLAKSKVMWIDSQKWRRDFKVDELYETFEYKEKAAVDKLYPRFYHKIDKDGRPIYIEQLGNIDLHKLYEVTTPERQLQSLVVEYEKFLRDRLPVCTEVAGHPVTTSCTIMDLANCGISQFWKVKNHVQEAASISQNNYPETMGSFFVINAPWAFSTIWSLVKGWLDPVTVAKIDILGSDYQKTLLERIPAESLPTFLGGKCQCPGGCSLSDEGPWKDRALVDKAKASQRGDDTHQPQPQQQQQLGGIQEQASIEQQPSSANATLPPSATTATSATSNGAVQHA